MEKIYILILCFFQMFISYGQSWTKIIISQQPQDTTVCQNGTAIFSVTASGAPTITYQWYHNGSVIQGATQDTLTLNTVQESDEGSYYCLLTNPYGPVSSNTATLTVIVVDPPPINGPHIVPENSIATYWVYPTTGSTYFFSVLCGTIVNTFPSSIVVQWTLPSYAQVRCTETNNQGCVSNQSVLQVIVGAVGINENSDESVSISPNPTNGKISISSKNDPEQISIYSVTGKLFQKIVDVHQPLVLDLSNFGKGLFFLQIKSKDSLINRKIVVF
jgi:hypothetical protein